MAELHQPHDKLLKATFSNPENARAFFRNHLPEPVAAACTWDSLKLLPSTFVDPRFSALESDLLFHVRIQDTEAFVYLLFEHQSREHPLMAFRLLSYVVRIWADHLEANPQVKILPPVLPVVLAQDGKPWNGATRLSELIGIPVEHEGVLRSWQPEMVFKLIELVRIPYADLRGTPEGVLTLRALKAEPVDELLSDPVWESGTLESISVDALERFFRYVCDREQRREEFFERLGRYEASATLKTRLMTIAEQLRAEGSREAWEKGREEGREEGLMGAKRAAVLRALELRLGAVPESAADRIRGVESVATLDALLEAAICAGSMQEFEQRLS
jgi:predicted transposase YdaD